MKTCLPLVRVALLGALVLAGSAVQAQTRLITDEEARAPQAAVAHTRAITRGPGISLLSPTEVSARSFAFKLAFEPRGGSRIDPASVKFEYLRQPVIDLTGRFKPALKGNLVDIGDASVPAGHHAIRVLVRDADGREGQSVIHLHAR